MGPLSTSQQEFILHWGEMSSRWGINRSVAQIRPLLYLTEEPLNAEQIAERLSLARSNVSTSLSAVVVQFHVDDRCQPSCRRAGCPPRPLDRPARHPPRRALPAAARPLRRGKPAAAANYPVL